MLGIVVIIYQVYIKENIGNHRITALTACIFLVCYHHYGKHRSQYYDDLFTRWYKCIKMHEIPTPLSPVVGRYR